MPRLSFSKERSILYNAAEAAFLLAIGLYIFTKDITKTTLHLDLPDNKNLYLMIVLAVTGAFRLAVMLIEERSELRFWSRYLAAALAIDAVYLMIYKENHYDTVVFFAILTIGSIGVHYIRVLKAYIAAASTAIFSAILMSWMGATDNFVFLNGSILRSSWGIKYPTDMMSLLLFLFLAVWIVCKDKDDLWFLIPGVILLAMSYFVAYSRTGMMCNILLLVIICLERFLSGRKESIFCRFIDICACAAFPLFTVLTNCLLIAFIKGNPLAIKANDVMSNRLAESSKVLNEYGLSLFGRDIPQNGWGGSTFATKDYSFVDISYILILLQYGIIALIMINIIWVLMTRKAVILGDRRLSLAMALIAFNAASEHHITQINYNILLAVPFAVLAVQQMEQAQPSAQFDSSPAKKHNVAFRPAVFLTLLAIAAITVFSLLPEARTITALLSLDSSPHRKALLFMLSAAALWLMAAAFIAAYRLCISGFSKNCKYKKLYIAVLAVFVAAAGVTIVAGNKIIEEGAKEKAELVQSEQKAIDIITETGTSELYVEDMPSLYEEDREGMLISLFNGEDLGRFENTSIITDKYLDSPILFNAEFLYAEISEEHALYTNDHDTIEAMSKEGYQFTDYFPLLMTVDMQGMADRNGLNLENDGSIVLHGSEEELVKGPRADLRGGHYTVSFDIEPISRDGSEPLVILKVNGRRGKDELARTEIRSDDPSIQNGEAVRLEVAFPDEEDVDLRVIPCKGNEIKVKGITYQKTAKL